MTDVVRFIYSHDGPDQVPSMPGCHGMLGWKEFLQNRSDILAEFDRAKALGKSRPVQTEHGMAVEAFVRSWLTEFLPKRYAVTSGFIIPNVRDLGEKLYHYDVIIYDQLAAPVLWASRNADHSPQGRSRAIPAKHVVGVYEVKSSLTASDARDAANKLNELTNIHSFLPQNFCCGVVFVDLSDTHRKKVKILETLLDGISTPGFWGGIVLRAGCDSGISGVIVVSDSDKDAAPGHGGTDLVKPIGELHVFKTDAGVECGPGCAVRLTCVAPDVWCVTKIFTSFYVAAGRTISLSWSHSAFSDFAVHVINSLDGIPYWSHEASRGTFAKVFDRVDEKPNT